MEVISLSLEGVLLIKPKIYRDKRGFFLERYKKDRYHEKGIVSQFVQENHSSSIKGTLRGMHFQSDPPQDKLVSVVHGKIFDVAVDIRLDSPTFGQWEGVFLDGDNLEQLFIPKGFAHGFCVLSDYAHVIYKISSFYNAETEKGFCWNDSDINIIWPIKDPILSKRDKLASSFSQVFSLENKE
jgi:dTDP-4-dehydrorhamnose 3,5-epimerase